MSQRYEPTCRICHHEPCLQHTMLRPDPSRDDNNINASVAYAEAIASGHSRDEAEAIWRKIRYPERG